MRHNSSLPPQEELAWLNRQIGRRGLLQGLGAVAVAGSLPIFLSSCAGGTVSGESVDSLTYLAADVPNGFDWDGPNGSVPTAQFGMDQCFGRLVRYRLVRHGGILQPDFDHLEGELAESWSRDGLVWTFKLRKGVRSPAGNEFTADDVVWLAERAKAVGGASPIAWFLYNVSSVMGAENQGEQATAEDKKLNGEVVKVDRYTVRITQQRPNKLFPGVLSVFAMSMIDSTEAKKHGTAGDPYAHDWVNTEGGRTAGFGPYRLESLETDHRAVFKTNPGWRVKGLVQPEVTTVTMNKVPQTSIRVGALLDGGGTKVTDDLTSRAWKRLAEADNVRLLGLYGNQNTFLYTNFKVKPFDNKLVRQALAYAMPYDDIVRSVYFGSAKRWEGCIPSSYPGYKKISTYTENVAKARSLLARAGYPGGKGLERFADAFTLFYTAEKQDQLQPLAILVQTALKRIGVPVRLSAIPQSDYGTRQLVTKDLPFAIDDQEKPIAADAGYAIQLFFVTGAKGGLNNMMNYSNAKVDDLWLNKAKNEADADRRNELLGQIQDIVMDEVAWIPLVEWKTQVAMTMNLTDYAWTPDNAPQMVHWRRP